MNKKYSLIDLHLHLDGSLTADDVIKMAELSKIKLDFENKNELEKALICPADCKDLNEYLNCFSLPILVMQSKEAISYSVYSLVKRLAIQGLIYAEIRFAPQNHISQGLTQEAVVEAAIDGLKKGTRSTKMFAKLILCCMRGNKNKNENMKTIDVAGEYLGNEVVAVDLAGAEGLYKTENFRDVFEYAYKLGIPFTIHAGEADGIESMKCAIDFGARRIGHGIRCYNNDEMKSILVKNNIALELCPTSNLQTRAVDGIKSIYDYPVEMFLDEGVCATINTDNMTVSNTSLDNEFCNLFKKETFNCDYAKRLIFNSINSIFADDETKEILLSKVNAIIEN